MESTKNCLHAAGTAPYQGSLQDKLPQATGKWGKKKKKEKENSERSEAELVKWNPENQSPSIPRDFTTPSYDIGIGNPKRTSSIGFCLLFPTELPGTFCTVKKQDFPSSPPELANRTSTVIVAPQM
jgi:hypothetical protein